MLNWKKNQHISILMAITVCGIASIYFLAAKIGQPNKFDAVITSFTSSDITGTLPLTASKLSNRLIVAGKLPPLNLPASGAKTVFIPTFEGHLTILADGEIIFDAISPIAFGISGQAVFELSPRRNGSWPSLTFTLGEGVKNYTSLAKIYIGEKSDFSAALMQSDLINSFFPTIILGVMLSIIFLLSTLVFTKQLVKTSYPTFIASLYIVAISIYAVDEYIQIPAAAKHLIAFCSPILIANLWLMGEGLSRDTPVAYGHRLQILAIVLSAFIIIWDYVATDGSHLYPSIFAAVFSVIGISIVSMRSFWISVQKLDYISGYFAISNAIFVSALFHDFGIRAGLYGGQHYMTVFGKIFFVLLSAISFRRAAFDASDRLEKNSVAISQALIVRTAELQSTFAANSALLEEQASAGERARIRQELHDGVLGYLSIINILTDGKTENEMGVINRSSRWASNEIRLLLETDGSQEIALLVAITNLRRQFIDRLSELGIAIEFDIIALAQLENLDFKVVIETVRILQEAVHNAAIRSRCTQLSISAQVIAPKHDCAHAGFRLVVRNSGGHSFSANSPFGNGLRNMWQRANRIGGAFQISSIDGGAELIFTWPGVFDLSSHSTQMDRTVGHCCIP